MQQEMKSSDVRAPARNLTVERAQQRGTRGGINVGDAERWLSAIGGGALAAFGFLRGSWGGWALAGLGGTLMWRGISGVCPMYKRMGMSTAQPQSRGIEVHESVAINASPAELYTFWRNFENLPQFMNHLESVTIKSDQRSHWVAKAPAGTTVEWDADITEERENEYIAWHSQPGADVENGGRVEFVPMGEGRGTQVKVHIVYNPPAGKLGALVAKLFGEEPNQQISEDLRRFKRIMETGEIATTEGQPHGERSALGKLLSPNN